MDNPNLDYTRPNLSYKTWPIDDDIVISGIGGRFPESDNIDELAANLINNVDMVTRDDRRWPIGLNDNQTSRSGKIKNLKYFDNAYFCTLPILADSMEPGSRIILETTYEAIADAGIAPQQIRGTKTGVYVGINTVANAEAIPQDDFSDIKAKDAAFWVYGSSKALLANRISFLFDLTGPSTVIDTACSASLVALSNAVLDLRTGNCDMAIVASTNLCMAPYSSYIFHALGLLSPDGKCKVFDKYANGFVRSETVGSLFLMRKSMAKRVYATILHAKTNTDGFKTIGLFAPFWLRQRNLMMETYQEAGLHPHDIDYFESHGTGTNVGDPQESKAVSEAYCQDRKDKLLVGAVKSNMGHAEGASGLCSVAKAIIIFEHSVIPANLHYTEPKPEIESLHKTIEPVVINTPFTGKIIGVNSFGVGGVNAHALLRINDKKPNKDLFQIADPIPRLVNVCGRTEEGVNYIFDFIKNNPDKIHRDFLALLNDSMKTTNIKGSANFPYRGYMLIENKGNDSKEYSYKQVVEDTKLIQPLWLIFSGMGSQWTGMGKEMMKINVFRESIEASAEVLKPYGVDLFALILSEDESIWHQSTVNSFVAITAMQIALFDLLRQLEMPVDGIIGHSFGEIACAYADGCITAKEAILTSYWRGKTVEDTKDTLPKGLMAAVGLTAEETKQYCVDGVYVACHNGSDSVTVSGLYEPMLAFMDTLQSKNIFVREVAGGEYPYHSVEMKKVAPKLLERLKSVIVEPKVQSSKWISTSILDEDKVDPNSTIISGEYFVNNLINPVLFEQGIRKIPSKAVCIEMAPHCLFSSIFKRCFKELNYLSVMKKNESDNLSYLLESIGQIYTFGFNPSIENLYPKVEWPVIRGTQSISSLLKWDYTREHEVKLYPEYHNFSTASNYLFKLSLFDSDWRFLRDHCIDKRIVFPATGYLMLVWRAMATKRSQPWFKVPIEFENIRIYRPTLLSETSSVKFTIQIIDKTNQFVVIENNNLVCKGIVTVPDNEDEFLKFQHQIDDDSLETFENDELNLANKEIYKELRIRGYDYGPSFQGLISASGDGKSGSIQWTGQWVSFVDSALHLSLLSIPIRTLFVPVGIESFKCRPSVLFDVIKQMKSSNSTKQEEENSQNTQLKSEFCYFRDMARNSEIVQNQMEDIAKNDETIPIEIMNFTFENVDPVDTKAEFKVKFDLFNQLLVTKGIEIKGLIPINIPRKSDNQNLILESNRFVPFVEEGNFDCESVYQIEHYAEICLKMLSNLFHKYSLSDDLICPLEDVAQSQLDKYCLLNDKPYKYLQCFKHIHDNKKEEFNSKEDVLEYLNYSILDFECDILNNGALDHELFARPIFELISENFQHKSIVRVLEITPFQHSLNEKLNELLKMNIIHKFELDYTITKHDKLKSNLINMKTVDWSLKDTEFLNSLADFDLVVLRSNMLTEYLWQNETSIQKLFQSTKTNGFVLVLFRDKLFPFEQFLEKILDFNLKSELTLSSNCVEKIQGFLAGQFQSISSRKHSQINTQITLFRKLDTTLSTSANIFSVYVDLSQNDYTWIDTLKDILKKFTDNEDCANFRIWILSNQQSSGIIGFANCLRLEYPYGNSVRVAFIEDPNKELVNDIQKFDLSSPTVKDLVSKDLAFSVFSNGQWGTYRFVKLANELELITTKHAYLSQTQRGDLSSLNWFQSEHEFHQKLLPKSQCSEGLFCNVYYSALNFKDIVLASGKLIPGPESSLFDCILGLEFSGRRNDTGERVMGMVPFKGIATTIMTFKDLVWPIPKQWSLEDAATVPVVYITAYYALLVRGQLKAGESVLIHSGAGGVGQAAINICQSLHCRIFVTVGTEEKRLYIQNKFNIPDSNICSSRDISFEHKIKSLTKGKGVNVVLNSLTGDKLQASIRCLAPNGRFLEIGKYDMQMNSTLGMFMFLNNISFHGVGLDCFFREGLHSKQLKDFIAEISQLIVDGIENGVVRPIDRTVFHRDDAEKAFRYMTSGKHIGKVLIQVRQEEVPFEEFVVESKPVWLQAISRTWFDPCKVYLVAGGLGGVGLELVYWMITRGARIFVLTSRKGIKSNFQRVFIDRFKLIKDYFPDYDINFHLSTKNIADSVQCRELIQDALSFGPIGGIFNLTLVLSDAYFENQTIESFRQACMPKFDGLVNLDQICNEYNIELDHFVAFSSYSAGRGNAGQCNYGFANSAMERIIEKRNRSGLNGIAIQFGPISDVGVVAEHLLQSDDNNEESIKLLMGLEMQRINSCLDVLDRLLPVRRGIFSSYVKYCSSSNKGSKDDEVIQQLCIHLNIDKRPDDECLGDIGLDSMAAVEIQQRLERDFNISLSLTDVRKITVKELKSFRDGNRHNLMQYSNDIKVARTNLSKIRFVMPTTELVALNSVQEGKPIYCFPPLKGIFDVISFLAQKICRPVIGLNWTRQLNEMKSLKEIVNYYFELLRKLEPSNEDGTYDLMVTSFGSLIAALMCKSKRMSARIKAHRVAFIDLLPLNIEEMTDESRISDYKVIMIFDYIRLYIPERICDQSMKEVLNLNCEKARVEKIIELLRKCVGTSLQGNDMAEIISNTYERATLLLQYHFKLRRKSKRSIRQLLINSMRQNKQLKLHYIKLICKSEQGKSFEKKLKLLIDSDECEEFEDQFKLHLIKETQNNIFNTINETVQQLFYEIMS